MNNNFKISKDKFDEVISYLEMRIGSNGYETQVFHLDGRTVFQLQKGDGLSKILGLSKALTIDFTVNDDYFSVSFSSAKWMDKAICGGIGAFVIFWPMLITSAVGAVQQSSLPNQIMLYISEAVHHVSQMKKGDAL